MINKILHQNEQNRDLVRLDSDLAEKCISHIEAEEQALAEERARLKEIFKGRIVIVLDAAMDDDRHMAELGISELCRRNQFKVAQVYREYLKKQSLETSGEVFSNLFGGVSNLINVDLRFQKPPMDKKPALVIVSGSSADVSKIDTMPNGKIWETGFTHHQVYSNTLNSLIPLMKWGTPIVGSCYGHHILARLKGGTIASRNNFFVGTQEIIPQSYQKRPAQGEIWTIPCYHQDYVADIGKAVPVFSGIGTDAYNHGLSYYPAAHGISAFTYQGHPEYAVLEPLFTFALDPDLYRLAHRTFSVSAASHYLTLIGDLVEQYG